MPLFARIKDTLGADGIKMLAFAIPNLDSIPQRGQYTAHVTTLVLSLYADAKSLSSERCAKVREMLASVIDPRKPSASS